jgi:hypothetical protein
MPDVATPETEAQGGLTEDQAVSELLNRWGATEKEPPQNSETEAAPAETEAEQPKGHAEAEEEAEEAPEAEGEVEIDVAGEKFKFPKASEELIRRVEAKAKEVEAGATRKFQEAADLRKAADVQTQTAKQLQHIAETQADLLADHRMVARRMQQLETIDLSALDNNDPGALARLSLEFNQLQAAKSRIEGQYQQNLRTMQDEETKAFQAKREHVEKHASTRIKGWGPEHWKKLSDYAVSKGVPPPNLQGITEPWMVDILDDAAFGHAMRQAKPHQLKRVETTQKTLKPGAAGNPKSAANLTIANATTRLNKTGKVDDAASLLLARMQARGGRKP